MTVLIVPALLTLIVVGGATFGPWLLRHAAPVLVRVPRLASALWSGGIVAWVVAVLAIGPMLAWMLSGPAMFTGAAGEFCQRCLDVANPFAGPILHTPIPVPALLAVPAVFALWLTVRMVRAVRRIRAATRDSAQALLVHGTRDRILGHDVWRVADPRPFAVAYPRHSGIVVSDGARAVLSSGELAAVLAHEQAHVTQRHHLVQTLLAAIAVPLRWIPLVRAASEVVPHYLEIAADNAARRRVGTTALASALLTLGAAPPHPAFVHADGAVLHATGPSRIGHLVAPTHAGPRAGTAGVGALLLGAITAISAFVHLPYVHAVVTGCV